MSEWRTDLPPKPDFYEADFGDPKLIRVWLSPVRASDYKDPTMTDGIVWGWDEADDPEAVEVECEAGHVFKWRPVTSC